MHEITHTNHHTDQHDSTIGCTHSSWAPDNGWEMPQTCRVLLSIKSIKKKLHLVGYLYDFDRLKFDYMEIASAMSFLKIYFPNGFPKMVIIWFTAAEGMSKLHSQYPGILIWNMEPMQNYIMKHVTSKPSFAYNEHFQTQTCPKYVWKLTIFQLVSMPNLLNMKSTNLWPQYLSYFHTQ